MLITVLIWILNQLNAPEWVKTAMFLALPEILIVCFTVYKVWRKDE